MLRQLTIDDAIAARDAAMRTVELNAGETFREQACEFVTAYLSDHGETPGERITEACKAAGIIPHDDRAFGPVYQRLSRAGVIEIVGQCRRLRGHGTGGGNVWRLKP